MAGSIFTLCRHQLNRHWRLCPKIFDTTFHISAVNRVLLVPSISNDIPPNYRLYCEKKLVPESKTAKLKRTVAEYGSTVIVFHVCISLMSLGTCYTLISSGLDVGVVMTPLGLDGSIAKNAGTFVTAYAIHKVLAPVRITLTITVTPFIVRYLRKRGILKWKKNEN